MIARNGIGGFFAAHYEWIALAVALAAVAAAGVFYAGVLGEEADAAIESAVRRIDRRKNAGDGVTPADLTAYDRVVKLTRAPILMGMGPDFAARENFLASGRRKLCAKAECAAPVPADAKTCPACGEKQPEEKKVVYDTDGDGLPDEWEKRFGLNVNDAADASADKDGDGFTNAEEFDAKTSPADADDHPDYLDSLKLQLPLQETVLPFYLRANYMKTPNGMKLEFFDPKKRNDYGRAGYRYSLFVGQPIGETGFTVKNFTQKTERRKIAGGGGAMRTVDISFATLERASDGKRITLAVEEKSKPVDVQATLVYTRGTVKTFTVVPGDTLDLNGAKYKVKAVSRVGKGAEVVLEHATRGTLRTVKALEP
jgi:hypothetical protein